MIFCMGFARMKGECFWKSGSGNRLQNCDFVIENGGFVE